MAFYQNQDDEEQQQQDPSAQGAGPVPSGQSGVISGQGASPQASGTPSQKAANPGNFVGITSYLDANKNQGSKLGDQVAGQISSSIQGASDEIGGITNKFNQKADSGTIQNLNTALTDSKRITDQASSQSAANKLGDSDINRFKEVSNAQYKGPNRLEDTELYQPAYQKMQQAQNYANLSKTEEGNQQLLRDLNKNDSAYSKGINRFDSYLMNNEDTKAKLAQSRTNADSLQGAFNNVGTSAAQYAADLAAKTNSARQNARSTLEDTRSKKTSDVDDSLGKIERGWNSEYDQFLNLLNNSDQGNNLNLTGDQMKKLGVDADQRIFNLLDGQNASNYLTMQAFDPNKVISKDQQAQLSALDQLASQYGGTQTNKFNNAEMAGTLNKEMALAADKFGLAAKEQQQLFDATAKITKMTSQLDKSSPLYEQQVIDVTRRITETLPWPANEIVKWVTDKVNQDVKVGNVETHSKTDGSVADYLSGAGPSTVNTGAKSLDWGTIVSPHELINSQADSKIKELQGQSEIENKQAWTDQILKYLQDSGYNKKIKSGT